jgi:predicted dithiol-disulfide oxidoreductase (DUF899 family)
MAGKHTVVSHDQWLEARKLLLAKEKQFTRLREELSQERRELPWEAVSKDYVFEGSDGKHLNQRDVTMVAVSHAPYSKLAAYQKRMGWSFKWFSSHGADFNFDYQASFTPAELSSKKALYNFGGQDPGSSEREGISVFYKDDAGRLFHTYSTYARGIDIANTAYNYLDMVPKGRDEQGRGQYWVRRHDEYAAGLPTDKVYASLQENRC